VDSVCQRPGCGHPKPLHSNGKTACKAVGCSAGPNGTPCPAFVAAEQPQEVTQA
jgi:hypothetical protein